VSRCEGLGTAGSEKLGTPRLRAAAGAWRGFGRSVKWMPTLGYVPVDANNVQKKLSLRATRDPNHRFEDLYAHVQGVVASYAEFYCKANSLKGIRKHCPLQTQCSQ
jgi:hypothetical protein